MTQVAPIGVQISLVMPDIAAKMAGLPIVSVPNCPVQLAAILAKITLVTANVSPVLTPVNSVPTKVSPVGTQAAILAQRKSRPQHREHHQTYDTSSHIASLVSGPNGLWKG